MFKPLSSATRLLVEAPLAPLQGGRFQPTGFADLGAATYTLPDGTAMLLVESAQSVANRLEATAIGPDGELVAELAGLSYIKVELEGASDATTSSLVEAHRLNSPFIITDESFQNAFAAEAGYQRGRAIDWRKVGRAIYKYDVNSLLHGAFMANLGDGRIKLQRSLSGFIEARDVREVVSGGVKNNLLDPSGKIRVDSFKKDVYGNVPYHRVEYTAGAITAFFNLDLGLIRSYDLGPQASELLIALGLLKVRRFLDRGLRLRTACDLALVGAPRVTAPTGFDLPDEASLLTAVRERIKDTQALFASPPVTVIRSKVVDQKEKGDEASS